MKKAILTTVALLVPALFLTGGTLVDQGAPGRQGPWPVYIQMLPDGGGGLPSSDSGVGSAWQCPIDINFANIANQNLGTDGTYTVGSYTLTKIHSTGSQFAIDAGSLVITVPIGDSTDVVCATGSTMPEVSLPITTYATGWSTNAATRIVTVTAGCTSSGNANAYFPVWIDDGQTTARYVMMGGFIDNVYPDVRAISGGCFVGTSWFGSPNPKGTGSVDVDSTVAGTTAFEVEDPAGVYASQGTALSYFNYPYLGSIGQPFWNGALPGSYIQTTYAKNLFTTDVGPASNWKLHIGAGQQAGIQALTCGIQRVAFCYKAQ